MFNQQPPLPLFHFTFFSIFNPASSCTHWHKIRAGDPEQLSPPAPVGHPPRLPICMWGPGATSTRDLCSTLCNLSFLEVPPGRHFQPQPHYVNIIPIQQKGKRGAQRHHPTRPRSRESGGKFRILSLSPLLRCYTAPLALRGLLYVCLLKLCDLTSCVSSGRWRPFLLPNLISLSRYLFASGFSAALSAFSCKTKPISTGNCRIRCCRKLVPSASCGLL